MRPFGELITLTKQAITRAHEDGILALINSAYLYSINTKFGRGLAGKYASIRNPISSRGVVIDVEHPSLANHVHLIVYRRYESEIISFIDDYLPSSIPVVEFGGGTGFVAAYIENHQDGNVEQVVIEPNPSIHETLQRTRKLNEATFSIEEKAYSPDTRPVEIQSEGDFTQASTTRNLGDAFTVDGISLSQIREKYDLSEFALIVDMEGGEVELLKEEMGLIEECCPIVIIEYHPFPDIEEEVAIVRNKIENQGYELLEEKGGLLSKCMYRRIDSS